MHGNLFTDMLDTNGLWFLLGVIYNASNLDLLLSISCFVVCPRMVDFILYSLLLTFNNSIILSRINV